MAFPDEQRGRFARPRFVRLTDASVATSSLDIEIAGLLASVSRILPTEADYLAELGLREPNDPIWMEYERTFNEVVARYTNGVTRPLRTRSNFHRLCKDSCAHAHIPATEHRTLEGWFQDGLFRDYDRSPLNNCRGTTIVASDTRHLLWVLDLRGEILVAWENRMRKHPSLAGGMLVWAAGEIGFENGICSVLDFQSGHYFSYNTIHEPETTMLRAYSEFVQETISAYVRIRLRGAGAAPAGIIVKWL